MAQGPSLRVRFFLIALITTNEMATIITTIRPSTSNTPSDTTAIASGGGATSAGTPCFGSTETRIAPTNCKNVVFIAPSYIVPLREKFGIVRSACDHQNDRCTTAIRHT